MYTIIVADDEEEIRRSLIRKVDWESTGFQVVGEAENGIEALELVEKLKPDLSLTDVKMPFISGIELARQVREIQPSVQIAFLSGYDDFTYAQQAIQYNIISYMLKPVSAKTLTEELKTIHKKMEDKFRQFASRGSDTEKIGKAEFLLPLLMDGFSLRGISTDDQLLQRACECGLLKTQTPELLKYVVIVTSLWDEEKRNRTTRSSMYAVEGIVNKYMQSASVYTEGKVISLLMATQKQFEKYLHILLDEISQSVERILKLRSVIGISRIADTLSGIHECYQEAMSATGYSQDNASAVNYIADAEPMEDLNHDQIQRTLEKVENLVRSGTEQELQNHLDWFSSLVESGKISQTAMNFMLLQIFSTLYKTVYAVAGSEAVKKLQEMCSLSYLLGGNGTIRQYKELCFAARKIISEQRRRSSEVLCEQAIHIIQEHFMEQELSLVSVSTMIAVSPNYLSAVLKKETGSTFKDLLTAARIEEAKNLILFSSMKIREIADKCGYNDQHYFSYCFKKYTGTSPNNFRRVYEEDQAVH